MGARPLTLVVGLLVAATGGCSWLLGVSEDPVVGDLGIDAALDGEPDGGVDSEPDAEVDGEPDAEDEAAVEDAPVE